MGLKDHLRDIYNKIPNWITLGRILLTPFLIPLVVWSQEPLFYTSFRYGDAAFVLFILLGLTDLADGYLARAWNQESPIGKILDPLADKIFIWIPLWLGIKVPDEFFGWTAFAFALDVALVILGIWAFYQYHEGNITAAVIGANVGGKLKLTFLCLFVGSLLLKKMGFGSLLVFGIELIRPDSYIRWAVYCAIGSIVGHVALMFFSRKTSRGPR
jgi:CDP-diacylglycerol--glycerol-3-phosphate 3-phosphatidyltransferase